MHIFSKKQISSFVLGKVSIVNQKQFDNISQNRDSDILLPGGYDYTAVKSFGDLPIKIRPPLFEGKPVESLRTYLPGNQIEYPAASEFMPGCEFSEGAILGINSKIGSAILSGNDVIGHSSIINSVVSNGHIKIDNNCSINGNSYFHGEVLAANDVEIDSELCIFNQPVKFGTGIIVKNGVTFNDKFTCSNHAEIHGSLFYDTVNIGEHSKVSNIYSKSKFSIGVNSTISGQCCFEKKSSLKEVNIFEGSIFSSKGNQFNKCFIVGVKLPEKSTLLNNSSYNHAFNGKRVSSRGYIGKNSEILNSKVNFSDIAEMCYLSGANIESSSIDFFYCDTDKQSRFHNVDFQNTTNELLSLKNPILSGQNKAYADMILRFDKGKRVDLSTIPVPAPGVTVRVENAQVYNNKLNYSGGVIEFVECEFENITEANLLREEGFHIITDKKVNPNQDKDMNIELSSVDTGGEKSFWNLIDYDISISHENKPAGINIMHHNEPIPADAYDNDIYNSSDDFSYDIGDVGAPQEHGVSNLEPKHLSHLKIQKEMEPQGLVDEIEANGM